jgi:hypothetical protein
MTKRERHESTLEQIFICGQQWVQSLSNSPSVNWIEINHMVLGADMRNELSLVC